MGEAPIQDEGEEVRAGASGRVSAQVHGWHLRKESGKKRGLEGRGWRHLGQAHGEPQSPDCPWGPRVKQEQWLQHVLCLVLGLHMNLCWILKVQELQAVNQLNSSQQALYWREHECLSPTMWPLRISAPPLGR